MIKLAILTTDSREHYRDHKNPTPYFGTAPEALLQGFAELPEIEVHVISCFQKPVSSPEKIAPNIWYHGLHVRNLGWMKTAYQGCIRAVRTKLNEIKPDIVHGQGTERDCALSAVFSGFPNVLTVHGNMRLIAKVNHSRAFSFNWLAAHLESLTIPRSQGVVCITNYTRDAVSDLAQKTWVVPNAVDQSFFEVQSSKFKVQSPSTLNLEPETLNSPLATVLCVGLVCHRKNQNNFIRSLDALAAAKKFQVVFLGGANRELPYDREFFDLLATRPWCVHGGFADRETLKKYLRNATLLALPSIEDNCPMVVLEAMAAGVPVLAPRVGGVPDLIADGRTGLLCDPLSAESMRTGVAQLLEKPEAARSMAAAARETALARFHPRVIAQRHLEIYQEVLSTVS